MGVATSTTETTLENASEVLFCGWTNKKGAQWGSGEVGKWESGKVGKWAAGQWAVGSGKWAVGSGKWAVGSGQWERGQGTADSPGVCQPVAILSHVNHARVASCLSGLFFWSTKYFALTHDAELRWYDGAGDDLRLGGVVSRAPSGLDI